MLVQVEPLSAEMSSDLVLGSNCSSSVSISKSKKKARDLTLPDESITMPTAEVVLSCGGTLCHDVNIQQRSYKRTEFQKHCDFLFGSDLVRQLIRNVAFMQRTVWMPNILHSYVPVPEVAKLVISYWDEYIEAS